MRHTLHRSSCAWRIHVAAITLFVLGAWSTQAHAQVVDASGYVTQDVVDICRIVAHAHHAPNPIDGPTYSGLGQAQAFAAGMLRRPAQAERLDAKSQASYRALVAPLSPNDRHALTQAFMRLGDVDAVLPPPGTYATVLIQGTTVPGMRDRVMALAQAVSAGEVALSPNAQIVFLDGDRPLFASETINVLLDTAPYLKDPTFTPPGMCPTNEHEAAEMVWRQLWLPPALRHVQPHFVHAPAPLGARRATTEYVVRHWLTQQRPQAGKALMVSENPFVGYQRMITAYVLHAHGVHNVSLEAMGPAGRLLKQSQDVILGVRLDNLAASLDVALALQERAEQAIQSGLIP